MSSDPKNQPSRTIPLYDRTVERGRGCYNCTHYSIGELALAQWKIARAELEAKQLASVGGFDTLRTMGQIQEQVAKINRQFGWVDEGILTGKFGLCMAGKSDGTFVENLYLCEHWSGVQGSSLATSGHKLDKLPDELKEIVDSRAKAPLGSTPPDDGKPKS